MSVTLGDAALTVNTIKTLAMDAVQAANSGHPGMPMGMADASFALWSEILNTDPTAPDFPDRDRFILSAGHGSMLLYALLHLSGHELSLEEIKQFRQLGSKTPGHPEVGVTAGVETTTGPLGQGVANGVGMAMAEAYLASLFNRDGFTVVDHFTYGICSDGDLQEGISHEAASLAGHLGLGKLIFLYDDNQISIDGATDLSFTEDVPERFRAYGWHVLSVDGHDRGAVTDAVREGQSVQDKPSLICCRTHIGHGSPNKQDSASSHGAPLGDEEIRLTKANIGWTHAEPFHVPSEAYESFSDLRTRGKAKREAWNSLFARYEEAHPELAKQWHQVHSTSGLPEDAASLTPTWEDGAKEATRASSGKVINALASALPNLWGGSADLSGSNKTMVSGQPAFQKTMRSGRNLHYGVREHAMAAAMNGMALHGGIIPYGGTFLTFSDYMRPSMRLAALMKVRALYVLTHDSIFLGEDGPTHQSVEHAMALRQIPGLDVMRPADGRETAAAWIAGLKRHDGPTALLLTRQGLPQLPGTHDAMQGVEQGAYIVYGDKDASPEIIMMASGSEVHLCVEAAERLSAGGHQVRVVSVPSLTRFAQASTRYQETILPPECVLRLSVECGRTGGWEPWVGPFGSSIGVDSFGESAPAAVLAEHFGITTEHVYARATQLLAEGSEQIDAAMSKLERAKARLVRS